MSVETKSQSWLVRDISLVLALKAAALTLLYFAFFAHPTLPSLTPNQVARHLDAGPAAPSIDRPTSGPEDPSHARH
ncbi:MAG TPA: hypothetical protein VMF53_08035 [Alphaproteobacteria bacterium]|nr:hypothetical protein [Alphaproteobacteria bacterium]